MYTGIHYVIPMLRNTQYISLCIPTVCAHALMAKFISNVKNIYSTIH